MIVSNCPRCGEAFRVPTDELPDDAYAQCPWCRDTFPVTEVLKLLPPVLQVLSVDGKPFVPTRHQAAALGVAGFSDTSASPGFGPAGSSDLDAASFNFEGPSSAETVVDDDTSESFELGEEPGNETVTAETVTDETWGEDQGEFASDDDLVDFGVKDPSSTWERDEHAPMRVSPARDRKSKGGGIGTAIKVVLGGVLAVPLAGGLLMAMGKTPDWGFWPFNGSGESSRSAVAAPPANMSTNRANESHAKQAVRKNAES